MDYIGSYENYFDLFSQVILLFNCYFIITWYSKPGDASDEVTFYTWGEDKDGPDEMTFYFKDYDGESTSQEW